MIRVEDLHLHFGGIRAVDGVSIAIPDGSITGLIGPNGAGKSTLFNVIAGLFPPTSGRVLLDGEDITGLPPHAALPQGPAAHLPDRPRVLHADRAREPDDGAGRPARRDALGHLVPAAAGSAPARREVRAKADEVIDFLEIGHVADELAGNLSGGQKKLLELGRTMMVDAKIVLLDEVGAGVNRTLLSTIADAILRLNRERGYTFCVIEHDMDFIARLCDPVIVMAEGKLLADGAPTTAMKNEAVIEAYLGRGLKNRPRPRRSAGMSFLIGDAMTGGYGGADILHGCTIAVDKGEIAVIVGPNGAGKSTAMKAVFGMLRLRSGQVASRRRGHHRALAAASGCAPAWASCRRSPTSSPR